jgi:predicted aminopeptidase
VLTMCRRHWQRLALMLLLAGLQGCYYGQAVRGQLELWRKSRPVPEVIADPATDAALADRLHMLQTARDFATSELLLPDNRSYRAYADLERDYVLWNVIAAPEFSLQPKTWCYLFVGCLGYRGYFSAAAAADFAGELEADGYDVFVGGVPAYSTLGKFADPILNTMLTRGDTELVALLFHELAHQRLYIKDDTAFNESFASAVAEFGVQQWHEQRGSNDVAEIWLAYEEQNRAVMALFDDARQQLESLYQSSVADAEKRVRKQQILQQLADDANAHAGGNASWIQGRLNNARLASFAMYRGYLPAFRRLFTECRASWSCFYAEVDKLAAMSAPARRDALAALHGRVASP